MRIKINQNYKSFISGKEVELPDFTVLTGKNGSGKSHFLSSLAEKDIAVINDEKGIIPVESIKYIQFNGLNPEIKQSCDHSMLNNSIKQIYTHLNEIQRRYQNNLVAKDDIKKQFSDKWYTFRGIDKKIGECYRQAVFNIAEKIGKSIDKINENDIRQYIDFSDLEDSDAFSGQFATIFKAYQIAYDQNEYNQYRKIQKNEDVTFYDETKFIELYGPKPWEFVNSILKEANLPYIVNNPENDNRDSVFRFALINPELNIQIQPSDLSTGERVLMSLAMAIYNSSKSIIKNRVLLIDEPDAPLHPEFSKFLIDTLKNHIVKKAGIKVIITTHSPTTVAIADEDTIFEMSKEEKIPKKIKKSEALQLLCEDIPSLRVTIDKQRIVFVESNYDAENYHKLFDMVNKTLNLDIQPVFHAANPHNGSNCDDVKSLVSKLENIPGVYGIIDFDNHSSSTQKVKVMGENGELRYTIENYILDPIFIGLQLLRDNLADCQIPVPYNYVDFKTASNEDKQKLIDWVCGELGFTTETKKYATISDETFKISKDWLEKPGHELEKLIRTKWI